jgi:uncharacterized protein (TIGR03437 family)
MRLSYSFTHSCTLVCRSLRDRRTIKQLATALLLPVLFALAAWFAPRQHAQQSGCATPSFVAAASFTTAPSALASVAGDFNLDGRPDLAVLNRGGGNSSVSLLLNNGNGGFAAYSFGVSNLNGAAALASGDFNGDGLPEFVVAGESSTLYRRSGNSYTSQELPPTGPAATVALGDFNTDGKLDVALGAANGPVTLLFGNGQGGFSAPVNYAVGAGVLFLLAADFDTDGHTDLAALSSDNTGFSILLSDGLGGFATPVAYTLGIELPTALARGDFNSDGKPDLVVTNATNNRVSVQLNSGTGAFNQAQNFGLLQTPLSIATGDFNVDGRADLAIGSTASEISLHLGNDTGQFSNGFKFPLGGAAVSVVAADLNNDGRVDVATANGAAGNASVLYNACSAPPANTPPTLTPGAALTRRQGGSGVLDAIATVNDAQTAAGSLQVFVTNPPAGISISNVTNSNGLISANVAAACNATLGANTLTLLVTDGGGLSASATLTILVTANTPPSLGVYQNVQVPAGAGGLVLPTLTPKDDGTITSLTATPPAGFSGQLSVNPATGELTIKLDQQPLGSYNITITARDDCNLISSQTLTLTVVAAQCVNPRPGLVSWYRGESNATDFLNNNNPSLANNIGLVTGHVGQALNFNGNSEVVIPSSPSLNFQQFTFEFWVYPNGLDGSVEMLINKEEDPYTTYQYEVGLAGPAGSTPVGTLLFALNGINGLPNDVGGFVKGGVLPQFTWTHVALTFNGTTLKTYLNGAPARTLSGLSGSLLTGNGPLKLGARSSTLINQLPQDRFNGWLDEVGLYSRALNEQEVVNIFNAGNAGKCTVPVNTPPTLQAGAAVTQPQGSSEALAVLATVNDVESEPGELTLTVTNAPEGIAINKITNVNGTISGNIVVGCTATLGANTLTLRVSDGTLAATASFTVNVTANRAPVLGSYASPGTLKQGESVTVTPSAAPGDNGTLTSLVATVAGNFTGSVSILPATGVVTLSNVRPAGTHIVNITAADNCGALTNASFSFTVSKFDTSVTLGATGAPYAQGQPAELTATVTTSAITTNPPSGTVTFFDGGNNLGSAPVDATGKARLTTTMLEPGLRPLTARYNGDAVFNEATSATLGLNVAFAAINVSAASYSGTVLAPEQLVAAFGTRLATTRATATTLPLPTTLAGTAVRILDSAGKEALAGLFFVSPTQVNYLMPSGLAAGLATITIVASDGISSIARAQIAPVNPGIFTADSSGTGFPAAQVLRVLANGNQSLEPVAQFDQATNKFVGVPIAIGGSNEQVFLILYGTGWRLRGSAAPNSATVAGANAELSFLGAQPSLLGVDQANLRLPSSLLARGEVEVSLTVDGKVANTVRISLK